MSKTAIEMLALMTLEPTETRGQIARGTAFVVATEEEATDLVRMGRAERLRSAPDKPEKPARAGG